MSKSADKSADAGDELPEDSDVIDLTDEVPVADDEHVDREASGDDEEPYELRETVEDLRVRALEEDSVPSAAILSGAGRSRIAETLSETADEDELGVTERLSVSRREPSGEAQGLDEQSPHLASDSGEGEDDVEFDRQSMVKTIRIDAVDRDEMERAVSSERIARAQLLGDHRLAPDILVTPPRAVVTRWQMGGPLLKAGAVDAPDEASVREVEARTVSEGVANDASAQIEPSLSDEDSIGSAAPNEGDVQGDQDTEIDPHALEASEEVELDEEEIELSEEVELDEEDIELSEEVELDEEDIELSEEVELDEEEIELSEEVELDEEEIEFDGGDEDSSLGESDQSEEQVASAPPGVSGDEAAAAEGPPEPAADETRRDDQEESEAPDLPEVEVDALEADSQPEGAKPPPQPSPPPRQEERGAHIEDRASAESPSQPPASTDEADEEMDNLVRELVEEGEEGEEAEEAAGPLEPGRDDWYEDVFSQEYLRTLPRDIRQRTHREADFIEASFGLGNGDRVLDLACGFGRHTVELTRRGYKVAGLDLSMPLLKKGLAQAQKESLSIKFIHGDMRELSFEEIFTGCFLWQTSFGYFDDRTNFEVLRGIHRALHPGGQLLIDVLNRDHIVDKMPHRLWWEGVDCIFLEEVELDHKTSVLHTKRSFIYEDGTPPLEHNSFIRLYSCHELTQLIEGAGFRVEEVSGELHHRGYFLGPASSRIIIRARRT